MPSSARGTAPCTAMSKGTMFNPIPMPASKTWLPAATGVRPTSQRESNTKARARQTIPANTTVR